MPQVDKSAIKIWLGNIAALDDDYQRYWGFLDQTEQQHALTIKNGQIHNRYVEIRARLRILLGNIVNAKPDQLRIHKAEHGKPYLVDYPEVAFNLSHSADKLAVAIAYDCDLGIDIEQCKPRKTLAALVDKCFAEEEKKYWRQLPEAERTQAFYRFWTRKEAFVKATGKGIALGLKQCAINPLNPVELLRIPKGYGEVSEWLIQDIEMGAAMCGALAVKHKSGNRFEMGVVSCLHPLPT
jgi:4'-phosphopantetheinyl transferase